MEYKKVTVFGLGYIGLPTAVLLAEHGVDVLGVDVLEDIVNTVNSGKMHIIEPGLKTFLNHAVITGKLRASLTPEEADAFIIAVPTPFRELHKPDTSFIKSACDTLAPLLKKGDLVILESTSPVGTSARMARWLSENRPDLTFPDSVGDQADVQIAHCPERVLPGNVVKEIVENDRIIGGLSQKASDMAAELYKIFVRGELALTNATTAEMCKLTENSFRDVNIAFANELSVICDKLGIDVRELIRLANRHPRVSILNPGCGVGGHCIAVDPWFIVDGAQEEARLIATAREVNDSKPLWIVDKVKKMVHDLPPDRKSDFTIACLGLSFKPDIDDLRESPALKITKTLADIFPAHVMAVEPNIHSAPKSLKSAVCPLVPIEDAMNADIIVLLVGHRQFKNLPRPAGMYMDATGIWD